MIRGNEGGNVTGGGSARADRDKEMELKSKHLYFPGKFASRERELGGTTRRGLFSRVLGNFSLHFPRGTRGRGAITRADIAWKENYSIELIGGRDITHAV